MFCSASFQTCGNCIRVDIGVIIIHNDVNVFLTAQLFFPSRKKHNIGSRFKEQLLQANATIIKAWQFPKESTHVQFADERDSVVSNPGSSGFLQSTGVDFNFNLTCIL